MSEHPRPDEEHFGEASLGDAEADTFVPAADDPYIDEDADPLDTEVEDADLFLGEPGDDEL
ncbi:MAG TPA: hypothetical protein VLB47_15450 [Solirubrobacteraceae bacterium]|nr:hypothetical protein [Solirubrobacteraceae bacterium]